MTCGGMVKESKSKASKASVPMHPPLAGFLLAWRERTKYVKESDYVFPRCAAPRGLWHDSELYTQSDTDFAFAVEQEHSWCLERIKAVEPCRMFLNVSFYRNEILARTKLNRPSLWNLRRLRSP